MPYLSKYLPMGGRPFGCWELSFASDLFVFSVLLVWIVLPCWIHIYGLDI